MGKIETGRVSVHGGKCALKRSVAATAAAALLASSMFAPAAAFAADQLSIANEKTKTGYGNYTEAASGNGWAWDGGTELALENYDGLYINATGGDLNITASGANAVLGVNVDGGNLSIQGSDESASLKVGTSDHTIVNGIKASGSVDISNIDLDVDAKFDEHSTYVYGGDPQSSVQKTVYGIEAGGDVKLDKVAGTIKVEGYSWDSNAGVVDPSGNPVESSIISGAKRVGGIGSEFRVMISNSDLEITAKTEDTQGADPLSYGVGIAALSIIDRGGGTAVVVGNSNLEITASDAAVIAGERPRDADDYSHGKVNVDTMAIIEGGSVGSLTTNGYIGEAIGAVRNEYGVLKVDEIAKVVKIEAYDPSALKQRNEPTPNNNSGTTEQKNESASSTQNPDAATSNTTQPVTTKADAESPKSASNSAVTGNKNNSASNSANNTPAKAATQAAASAPQTPKTADNTTAPFAAVCAVASAALMAVALRMRKETFGKHVK